jgi:hypothetical protein
MVHNDKIIKCKYRKSAPEALPNVTNRFGYKEKLIIQDPMGTIFTRRRLYECVKKRF